PDAVLPDTVLLDAALPAVRVRAFGSDGAFDLDLAVAFAATLRLLLIFAAAFAPGLAAKATGVATPAVSVRTPTGASTWTPGSPVTLIGFSRAVAAVTWTTTTTVTVWPGALAPSAHVTRTAPVQEPWSASAWMSATWPGS